jgi:chromosome segregation ATPase
MSLFVGVTIFCNKANSCISVFYMSSNCSFAPNGPSAQAIDKARSETTELQAQLGDLRQKIGTLEGSLQGVTASRDMITKELKGAQEQAAASAAQVTLLRADADNWRRQAEESQKMLTTSENGAKPERVRRKSKAD